MPVPLASGAASPHRPRTMLAAVLGDTVRQWGARIGLIWVAILTLAAILAPVVANSLPLAMKVDGIWSSPMLRYLDVTDVVLLLTGLAGVVTFAWPGHRLEVGRVVALATFAGWVAIGAVARNTLWPFVRGGREWFGSFQFSLYHLGSAITWLALWGVLLVGCYVIWRMTRAVVATVDVPRGLRFGLTGTAIALAVYLAAKPIEPPLTVDYSRYRVATAAGEVERAIYAPLPFSPADYQRENPDPRLKAPTWQHPLGTTLNGADLLSNMIHACRIALSIGFISTGIAVAIGIVVGGLMGYFAGWVDLLGMRVVEIFSSIPTFLLLLCFVAFFTPNLYVMMAIIGFTGWTGYAVFVRAEFLRLRNQDFVHAATATGLPLRSILFKHMLPNGVTPIIISASFGVASAILAESSLSFLGIGLVGEASWGNLLNQALGSGGTFYWWIAMFPGLAIFLTVFAYNLIGEALRDALDPKMLEK
jgi:peptide/nickel transport system permease protein